MSTNTASSSMTETASLNTSSSSSETESTPTSSPLDQPRVDLVDQDPTQMDDQTLLKWIQAVRERRTSNALAAENRPVRRTSKAAAEESAREQTKKAVLSSLGL